MYNIDTPVLQLADICKYTHIPKVSGFIFNYYEWQYDKPRELFFSNYLEAKHFAVKKGAEFSLAIDGQPERLSAIDFCLDRPTDVMDMADPPGNTGLGRPKGNIMRVLRAKHGDNRSS